MNNHSFTRIKLNLVYPYKGKQKENLTISLLTSPLKFDLEKKNLQAITLSENSYMFTSNNIEHFERVEKKKPNEGK